MKFKPALLVIATALSLGSAQAVETVDLGAFTLEYDETTELGSLAFTSSSASLLGFGWNLPSSFQAISIDGAAAAGSFALPWFKISVNPGHVLTGDVESFIGNLVYNLVGNAAAVSASVSGTISVDGLSQPVGGDLDASVTANAPGFESGYLSGVQAANFGVFSSLEFSGGVLSLLASGGSFASIIAQPQNQFSLNVAVAEVPEPASMALMLGGLAVVGGLASRRRQRG